MIPYCTKYIWDHQCYGDHTSLGWSEETSDKGLFSSSDDLKSTYFEGKDSSQWKTRSQNPILLFEGKKKTSTGKIKETHAWEAVGLLVE